MVLYSAVSSPLDRSKRFTLFALPDRPVHSDTNSASPGSILAMHQLRNDYSLTCPPLSIARYSFIQLSRLRRREENENAQTSKLYQRGFEPRLSRLRVRHSTTELARSTSTSYLLFVLHLRDQATQFDLPSVGFASPANTSLTKTEFDAHVSTTFYLFYKSHQHQACSPDDLNLVQAPPTFPFTSPTHLQFVAQAPSMFSLLHKLHPLFLAQAPPTFIMLHEPHPPSVCCILSHSHLQFVAQPHPIVLHKPNQPSVYITSHTHLVLHKPHPFCITPAHFLFVAQAPPTFSFHAQAQPTFNLVHIKPRLSSAYYILSTVYLQFFAH